MNSVDWNWFIIFEENAWITFAYINIDQIVRLLLSRTPSFSGRTDDFRLKNKNRPIFISQVEVIEYYSKMNFFCFSFALNQKYRAANFSRLIAAKSGLK